MNFFMKAVYLQVFAGFIILVGFLFFSTSITQGQVVVDENLASDQEQIDETEDVVLHNHAQIELAGSAASLKTEKDTVPNFAAFPTVISKQNGNWSSPSTWVEGRVPGVDDVVKVAPGHTVTYDTSSNSALAALGIEGVLKFSTTKSTLLKVGTILVYRNGSFQVGTESAPIPSNVKVEIIIADRPLATSAPDPVTNAYDPQQFGTGIVSFGEVIMHGHKQDSTWLRLTQEPKAGQQTLFLESEPTGWSVGDELVLPDTRQTPLIRRFSGEPNEPIDLQLEELTIASISGKTVTLTAPLKYDHLGGRDTDGNLIALPHIGNLSRNILIRSEAPSGTRGHTLLTERSRIDIRYASFVDMGRTTADPLDNTMMEDGVATKIGINQIGRYPVHFHHMMGPVNPANTGYQFAIVGNSVVSGAKWGIAVHNSHFGLVSNNVVYDIQGSGIITEAANERENVFERNFVVKMGTPFHSLYNPTYGGVAGPNRPLRFGDFGWEGTGLWFSGNDNYVRGNVVANAAFAGVMYNARIVGFGVNLPLVPKFRGAEIGNSAEWTEHNRGHDSIPAPKIRESSNNEVYAVAVGLWVSFSGEVGKLSNYLMWNIKQKGLYSLRNASVSYDNITIISDQSVSNANHLQRTNLGLDFGGSTYHSGTISFTNSRVEGFNRGVKLPHFLSNGSTGGIFPDTPPVTVLDNVYLRNYVNVVEGSTRHAAKYTLLRDLTLVQNSGPANKYIDLEPTGIQTKMESNWRLRGVALPSQTLVYNYKKEPGNDFEIFFREQAPDYVMALREINGVLVPNANCPTVGLTNAECWAKHQVAYLGRVATCTDDTTRPEIDGFTCPIVDATTFQDIMSKLPTTPPPSPDPIIIVTDPTDPIVVPPLPDDDTGSGVVVPDPAPTLQFTSSADTIKSGESVTLDWTTTFANSCLASSNWTGTKAISGSETVGPLSETQTFTLTCTGSEGDAVKNITVTVEEVSVDPEPKDDFAIASQSVSSQVSGSAVINVVLNESGTIVVNYGNSVNNLNKTVSSIVGSLTHNLTLDSLKGNSTFYQIVATNETDEIISSVTFTFENIKTNSGSKSEDIEIQPASLKTGDSIDKQSDFITKVKRSGGGSSNRNDRDTTATTNTNNYATLPPSSTNDRVVKNNFLRHFYVGVKGEDVRQLQKFLNSDPDTRISIFGDGAIGSETDFFGNLTAEAVGKFQIKHGLLQNRGQEGFGQVGPRTLAKMNSLNSEVVSSNATPLSNDGRANIMQQIQELLNTVQVLQLQLRNTQVGVSTSGAIVPASTPTYGSFVRNLAFGSEGEDVRQLQVLLNKDPDTRITGLDDGAPGFETTFFGKKTEDAVKRFQRKHGIVFTGTPAETGYGAFGPATRNVMSGR